VAYHLCQELVYRLCLVHPNIQFYILVLKALQALQALQQVLLVLLLVLLQ
jgi:hypothetical protein